MTAVLIGLGGLVLATAVAQAQAAPPWCVGPAKPCNPDDPKDPNCYQPPPPDCRCEPLECGKCQKSPNFVGSGVYSISETDLQIPTPGFPLEVSRSYTSTNLVDGPLGYGWSTNLVPRAHLAVYLFAAPDVVQSEAVVVMPDGARYRFTRNGDGSFTPPLGRYDKLVANADGTFDMTLQRSRSVFHFNADGTIGWMADDFNNRLEYTYDGNGRLSRVADAAGSGRYLDVYWGADGRLSTVADHTGRTVGYVYDSDGNLIEVTDPLGRRTSYFYTPGKYHALLSQVRDNWDRIVTTTTYDAQDRVKSYTDQDETWTYTYSYQGDPSRTAKSDSLGNSWVFTVDSSGLVTTELAPGGAMKTTSYYADGSTQLTTDELGVKALFIYDATGRLLSETRDYLGSSAIRFDYSYDPTFANRIVGVTPTNPYSGIPDPNWQAWRFDYFPEGSTAPGKLSRMMRVHADGLGFDVVGNYAYDPSGRLIQLATTGGGTTDFTYDSVGNLVTVVQPPFNDEGARPSLQYSYDGLGRQVSAVDASGAETLTEYDALGRVTFVRLPKPSPQSIVEFSLTFSYDSFDAGSGLVSSIITDSNSSSRRIASDVYGRPVIEVDALGAVTSYTYMRNQLASVRDANQNVTSFARDARGRLSSTTFPDGSVEQFEYSPDSSLLWRIDRLQQRIDYTYDRLKRLIGVSYADGHLTQYSYLGELLVQVLETGGGTTELQTLEYDSSLRLRREIQGERGSISYSYGTDGLVATTSVENGPVSTYTYWPNGRLQRILWSETPTATFDFDYNARGQLEMIRFPNGQRRENEYDGQGRLRRVSNSHPVVGNLAAFEYGYDEAESSGGGLNIGLRTSTTQSIPSMGLLNARSKYHFDANSQISAVEYPSAAPFGGRVDSWQYDAIGNRVSASSGGSSRSYSYQRVGGNPENWTRLVSDGENAYTHDLNGQLTLRASSTASSGFTWDSRGRLGSISGDGAATFNYDYQGRRTLVSTGLTTENYLYDGLNPVAKYGEATANFLHGPGIDRPLAVSDDDGISYLSSDGLGSIVATSDELGNIENAAVLDVWGNVLAETGSRSHPFGFTAREDSSAGLIYYRARSYSPTIGRFVSEDPMGHLEGPNPYLYVRNRPTIAIDPLGLQLVVEPPPNSGDPLNPPPPGCTGSRWRFVEFRWVPLGTREIWSFERGVPAGIVGKEGDAEVGCWCYYTFVGAAKLFEVYSWWRQRVTCPPCGSFDRFELRPEGQNWVPEKIPYKTRPLEKVQNIPLGCEYCPPFLSY